MRCQVFGKNNCADIRENGQPCIVFDAGMGNWSLFFYPLTDLLSNNFKIVLIDRDGYYDDAISVKYDGDGFAYARSMRKVLLESGITGKVILAGHSLGGIHMRFYQKLYPEQVSGLILLDSAHPHLYDRIPKVKSMLKKQIIFVKLLKFISGTGLLRKFKSKIPTFGLPRDLYRDYFNVVTGSGFYRSYLNELLSLEHLLLQSRNLERIGNLPLLILSSPYGLNQPVRDSKNIDKNWLSLQKEFMNLSGNSICKLSNGDHFLHLTDTKFVAESICDFVYHKCLTKKPEHHEWS